MVFHERVNRNLDIKFSEYDVLMKSSSPGTHKGERLEN
jgi:hypothetical protein